LADVLEEVPVVVELVVVDGLVDALVVFCEAEDVDDGWLVDAELLAVVA
jgi:hypothetical protein